MKVTLRRTLALTALATGIVLTGGALGIASGAADPLLARWAGDAVQDALDGADWEAGPITLEDRPGALTWGLRDVHLEAGASRFVLREMRADDLTLSLQLAPLLHGEVRFDVQVDGVEVRMQRRTEKPPIPEPPEPGPIRFAFDIDVVDGTWIWTDPTVDFEARATDVHGRYTNLGTASGPGQAELEGRLGQAPVFFDATLDFFAAHRDAVDLRVRVEGATPADLQGADQAYANLTLEDGTLDTTLAVTWDLGEQELSPPYRTGQVDDVQAGRVVMEARLREGRLGGLLTEPVTIGSVTAQVAGPLDGSGPVQVDLGGESTHFVLRAEDLEKNAGGPNPGTLLARVPDVRLDLDLRQTRLTWADERIEPRASVDLQDLAITLDGLSATPGCEPATLAIRGAIAGGTLNAAGTVRGDTWPPPAQLTATVQSASARELAEAFEAYHGAKVHSGTLDVAATLDVTEAGEITPTTHLTVRDLAGSSYGWTASARAGQVELFAGEAELHGLTLRPHRAGSAITDATARRIGARWDMQRYLAQEGLMAEVVVDRPVIQTRRPESSSPLERPRSPGFDLDVQVRRGRVVWTDPTVDPDVSVAMDPVDLTIEDLGTRAERAHWTLDATLERGGTLTGEADVDAFSGLGRTPDPQIHADVRDIPLDAYRDVARAYLGLEGLSGEAEGTFTMDGDATRFTADARHVSITLPIAHATTASAHAEMIWRPGDAPEISGEAHGATVVVGEPPADAQTPSFDRALRVPRLDVTDLVVDLPLDGTLLHLADARLEARDIALPEMAGSLAFSGRTLGGSLHADLTLGEPNRLQVAARELTGRDLNPWLRPHTGFDLEDGQVEARADLSVAKDKLEGELDVDLLDAKLFDRQDWKKGFFKGLGEAGAGALLGLATRDGAARITLNVEGTPTAPKLDPVQAAAQALRRGIFGAE